MQNQTEMKYLKSTLRTHVYESVDSEAAIPTLYIKKDAFDGKAPETIKVTIEA